MVDTVYFAGLSGQGLFDTDIGWCGDVDFEDQSGGGAGPPPPAHYPLIDKPNATCPEDMMAGTGGAGGGYVRPALDSNCDGVETGKCSLPDLLAATSTYLGTMDQGGVASPREVYDLRRKYCACAKVLVRAAPVAALAAPTVGTCDVPPPPPPPPDSTGRR